MNGEIFIEELLKKNLKTFGEYFVDSEDVVLPIKVFGHSNLPSNEVTLIFLFHGQVNREKVIPPGYLGGFLYKPNTLFESSYVLGLSDPDVNSANSLPMAFYQGSRERNVPASIHNFVRLAISKINPKRIIFVGTSSGGHATLYHSSLIEGSVAIAMNPILDIENYYKPYVLKYLKECWKTESVDDVRNKISLNCASQYKKKIDNNIIYLTNARDHHVYRNAIPFLNEVRKYGNYPLFISTFFESYPGHTYPEDEWALWVKAAVYAKDGNSESIATLAYEYLNDDKKTLTKNSEREISLAQKIHDFNISNYRKMS